MGVAGGWWVGGDASVTVPLSTLRGSFKALEKIVAKHLVLHLEPNTLN